MSKKNEAPESIKIQLKNGFITVSAKIYLSLNETFTDLTKITIHEALTKITEIVKTQI